ncbi:MAG: ribbon-helix-helix protein, CopG family [Anaerolineales bacterium]|nr:ribbon-helix-helix protein, CopG family [Anaerolineales bacterium]
MRKRDAYIHIRVTQREMQTIDALARHLRRTRSDLMRVLALEKAEELDVSPVPRPVLAKRPETNKGEDKPWTMVKRIR